MMEMLNTKEQWNTEARDSPLHYFSHSTRYAEVLNEMSKPSVSVVIPAYNEGTNMNGVLTAVGRAMRTLDWIRFEIVVVDDGSTDETRKIAEDHGVVVLSSRRNRGKGWALQQGFKRACGDIIVTMDADDVHDPGEISKLVLPILDGADVVIGSRFIAGQGNHSTKRLHILGNRLINILIFLVTGRYVTDSQTGFRAFKKEVIRDFELRSSGYQVETEFTVKTLQKRACNVVKEVPITIRTRQNGKSHVNALIDGLKILVAILKSSMN